jgi:hypothetical protein
MPARSLRRSTLLRDRCSRACGGVATAGGHLRGGWPPPLTRPGVERSVGLMDKLAPWPEGSARISIAGVSIASVLIASVLAWALVLQGGAIAASAGLGAARLGFDAAAIERCAAERGDGHRPAPEPHAACSCCLPGRSGPLGGFEGLALAASGATVPRAPIAELVRLDLRPTFRPVAPRGCIGSWSPRAPPRLGARFFPPRAREA